MELALSRREPDRVQPVLSFEGYLGMRRFPALDGLRGVAALMVVAYHFGGRDYVWLSGWTGIQIFFVLSGFLITTLALREESSAGRVSLGNFWLRRLFRILPAYLVVLLAMVVTTYRRGGSDWTLLQEALPHYWTFTNEFGNPESPWMLSWTLGIEQKFYLVWPLLAFAVALTSRVRLAVIGLLAVVLTLAASSWGDAPGGPASYVSILIGCALAVSMHTRAGFDLLRPLMTKTGRTIVLVVFLLAQLLVARSHAVLGEVTTVAYVVVVAAVLPGLLTDGAAATALSTRPMRWLGARSYSLYLCQILAAWTVYALLPAPSATAMVVATAVVGLIVADFLYRYVEAPMIRAGRHLERVRSHEQRTPPGREAGSEDRSSEPDVSAAGTGSAGDATAARRGGARA